ncbi:TPA: glycosyltransferase [Vibrio parahaemolyticus]|nr:glycosyltransferase [Vibrio parahaemolyticus]
MLKLSIVTTIFNASKEEFLDTANSILSQKNVTFEYIIQDGQSSNVELVECANNLSIEFDNVSFYSERDTGIYSGMNNALKHCTGDYVMFINSGDCFINDHALSEFVKSATDESDIVVGLGIYYGSSVTKSKFLIQKKLSKLIMRNLCHQSYMVRLNDEVRFDESYKLASDFDLLSRIYNASGCSTSYNPNSFVFYKAGGVSDLDPSRVYGEIIHSIAKNNNINFFVKIVNMVLFKFRQVLR